MPEKQRVNMSVLLRRGVVGSCLRRRLSPLQIPPSTAASSSRLLALAGGTTPFVVVRGKRKKKQQQQGDAYCQRVIEANLSAPSPPHSQAAEATRLADDDGAAAAAGGWRGGNAACPFPSPSPPLCCTPRPRKRAARLLEAGKGFCTLVAAASSALGEEEPHGAAADSLSQNSYMSVRIRCHRCDADIFSEALLCFGASSASVDESDNCEDLDEILITSIFENGQDVHMCISRAANSISLEETPSFEVTVGEQCDWIRNAQVSFHPIEVTDGLWIVPEWKTPPDIHATNILLNPGMAFGTGEHPTTKLCLLLLHRLLKGGEAFLDYGTGSGILGIAALKMGASLSVGVDIDPQALSSARQNMALNKIKPEEMLLFLAPSNITPTPLDETNYGVGLAPYDFGLNTKKEKFDIVVANILLNPLMELAEEIVSFGKAGAIIGVSGILSEQLPQIEEQYSKYLENMSASEMDGWACLSGTKR